MNLYPFQQKAADWLASKDRAILGSEVGTGKTPVACSAVRGVSPNALIYAVVPSSVKYSWENQVRIWDNPSNINVLEKLSDKIVDDCGWWIMSYNYLTANHEKIPIPDILILDEAQHLQSHRSKRCRAILYRFARKVRRVWLLTGTPFPNTLINAWTLFAFCLYGKFERYWEFANKYCYVRDTQWGKKASGCRKTMLPELVEKVRPILHRDTVEANLQELPDFQDVKIPLTESVLARAIIDQLEENREEVKAAIEEGKPVSAKTVSLYRELGLTKIDQAVDFIKDLVDQDLQVVVFAHHVDVVAEIASKLPNAAPILGSTPSHYRQRIITSFQAGKTQCIVASILAAGEGITLTAARIAVFVELAWKGNSLGQAKARLRRIGQKNFCTYYFLQYPDSIDDTIYNSIKAKERSVKNFWDAFEGNALEEGEEIVWPD